MLLTRPDWCISRQRTWGVPITIFYCDRCREPYWNHNTFERIIEEIRQHGADIWFEKDASYFLADDAKCSCGNTTFTKEEDILDVWFDSGSSFAAVLKKRNELAFPADMYLEGSDQHRGWFHSSLLVSVGNDGIAPYKSVLTHGFFFAAKGVKMSKSLGNVIAPAEIIRKIWSGDTKALGDLRGLPGRHKDVEGDHRPSCRNLQEDQKYLQVPARESG